MRDTDPPGYDPPAPGETLQQWLADSSEDWIQAQPTMWMPAVPADVDAPPPPAIPRQRDSGPVGRRGAVPGGSGPAAWTNTAQPPDPWASSDRTDHSVDQPGSASSAVVWAAVVALLATGLALTPWIATAAAAIPAGGWSVMVARNHLARPAYGVPSERRRRALCLATLVVAAVAVGMSGSAVWSAVASMGGSG